jgi:hypothetical protein
VGIEPAEIVLVHRLDVVPQRAVVAVHVQVVVERLRQLHRLRDLRAVRPAFIRRTVWSWMNL